jgi:hypothetical protein
MMCLVDCGVKCFQAVEDLLECWRKAIVCFYLACEEGVAAYARLLENEEEGGGRWLLLVCHV